MAGKAVHGADRPYLATQLLGLGTDVGRPLGHRWAAAIVALAALSPDQRLAVVRLLAKLQEVESGCLNIAPRDISWILPNALTTRAALGGLSMESAIRLLKVFFAKVQALATGSSRRREAWSTPLVSSENGILFVSHPAADAAVGLGTASDPRSGRRLPPPRLHCQVCGHAHAIGGVRLVERVNTLTFERQDLGPACDLCRSEVLRRNAPPPEWLFVRQEPEGQRVALFDNLDPVKGEARGVAVIDLSRAHPRIQPCDDHIR